jgi:hypothetical protein
MMKLKNNSNSVVEQKVLHGSPEEDQMLLSRSALLARLLQL